MPHLLYAAYGFPPAAKSGSYRMRGVANAFAARGWDVTVMTLPDEAWLRETGLDQTLTVGIDPRVHRTYVPVAREDLEPDVRRYSRERARYPQRWRDQFEERSQRDFPEPTFGPWRSAYERVALEVHARTPVDLMLVSPQPNVQLAAALALHDTYGVPYAVDFRDGWSLDVVSGRIAFGPDSRAGRWEARAVEGAEQVWFVNNPIRGYYADRYPQQAHKFRVVRNGFDDDLTEHQGFLHQSTPPLRFGYLGTASFKGDHLQAMIGAWRRARLDEPALAGATLEFRGHIGSGFAKGSNSLTTMILDAQDAGVSYGGPVEKRDVGAVYTEWDALVLALVGGEYVTSGKVYEYMATGLPIVSVHASTHAAVEVLEGYPLWVPPRSSTGLDVAGLAESFASAARLALATDSEAHRAAAAHAAQFERSLVLGPAVAELASLVEEGRTARPRLATPGRTDPNSAPDRAHVHTPAAHDGPVRIMLLAGTRPNLVALQNMVPPLARPGVEIELAMRRTTSDDLSGLPLSDAYALRAPVADAPSLSPEWMASTWRSRVLPRIAARRDPVLETWVLSRRSPRVWEALLNADIVVALDRFAVYTAWRVAQERPDGDVVLGLTEAGLRLDRILAERGGA